MPKRILPGDTLVVFTIDDKLFALPLEQVIRVERSVKITTVHDAPSHLFGVIDNHGAILPVIDIRRLTGMPLRQVTIDDQMIMVQCHYYTVVIIVDKVVSVVKAENVISAEKLMGKELSMPQVMSTPNGIVLVLDAEQLLNFNATLELREAVEHLNDSEVASLA